MFDSGWAGCERREKRFSDSESERPQATLACKPVDGADLFELVLLKYVTIHFTD